MKLFIKIITLLIFLSLGGCRWFTDARTPFNFGTNIKIPEGTPAFQTGFKDGCSTALYSRGNVFYRTKYGYRYDPKMIGNTEYHFGHRRGYSWCFLVALAPLNKSFDAYIEDPPFDMSAGDIGSAWDGFFGGVGGTSALGSNPTAADNIGGIIDLLTTNDSGQTAIGTNPFWSGNSVGQFFGQRYK